jgi:hypothetical protein
MAQVTLVSLYGEKKSALATLIAQCQELVTNAVGAAFTPYDIRQIHATITGLEALVGPPAYNANFAKYRGRDVVMDFDGFFAYLRVCDQIPFEVQIGGFANRDYPFTSRKTVPYERSFSVQGDKVVVMGWPIRGEPSLLPPSTAAAIAQEARIYPATLDAMRHAAQRFGILHGWHKTPIDVDNDLFFRIGMIDSKSLTPAATSMLESQGRDYLTTQPPLVIEIPLDDISVAAYEDDQLPLASTRASALTDSKVTGDFVVGLYT